MMPVLLWTDALIFLLTAVVIIFVIYARSKPHLRAPWRRVLTGRIAAGSMVILLAFVATGLLDSVHFRLPLDSNGNSEETHYSVEVLSVLDVILGPIRTQVEKTYSAPFATHLFAKETIERADGTQVRDYPRLQYGGAHLADPGEDRGQDILQRSLLALVETLLAAILVLTFVALLLGRRTGHSSREMIRAILTRDTALPWRTILLTITLLLLLIFLVVNLASVYHVLGTDKVGQDVFYQSLKSIRTGLVIGTLTTLIMLPFAIFMGIVAGYARGWTDDVVQYTYTTLNSIPGVLLIAASILMLQVYIANPP
jgi:peptide/nickel transport system permease protein